MEAGPAGAYGKAGNGNEMETGNGNWKQNKWKRNLLAVVVIQKLLLFVPRHPSPRSPRLPVFAITTPQL